MRYLLKEHVMRTLFFLGLLLLIGSLAVEYYLTGVYVHYPQAPQTATQQILPYHVRSVTVYVTPSEMNIIRVSKAVELVGLALAGFAIVLRTIRKRDSADRK